MRTSWLIGGVNLLPEQTIQVNGLDEVIAEAPYYLYFPTDTLSLLAQIRDAMTNQGVANAVAELTKDRRVRLAGDGVFTIDWPVGFTLQLYLGFTADLAGANEYISPQVPTLLWSPGRTETPRMAPLGIAAHPVTDATVATSRDSTQVVTRHFEQSHNMFFWPKVHTDRYQVQNNLGGTWARFWRDVIIELGKFYVWRNVDEDGSTDPANLDDSMGPYEKRVDEGDEALDWSFERSEGFQWTDAYHPVTLPVLIVPQYT